jgi:mRNA-degrading endonuclease RelE of RelBE toxin-antitoxin system
MSFNILRTDIFTKHLKQLAKKYPSLKNDFSSFLTSLENDPLQGISLGKNCYKVRLKINSKNTGKSGGGRIITLYVLNRCGLCCSMYMIKQTAQLHQIKN